MFEGERIVICGPSGSGRSTLIRCLNGLENINLAKLQCTALNWMIMQPQFKIRQNVGMVFQQFNLFPHLTVLENCTLAPIKNLKMNKSKATELAMHYLERVQIPEQANKLPGHLQVVSSNVSQLQGPCVCSLV